MASNPATQFNPPKKNPKTRSKSQQQPGSATFQLEDVMINLECPICQEHLRAPIFMCSVGHNLCHDCKFKLTSPVCPICKCALTTQRNYALESICEKLCQPCANAKFGCQYTASPEKLKEHTPMCEFRQHLCPYGVAHQNCTWKGRRFFFVQHFNQAHPNKMCVKPGSEVVFNTLDVTKNDCDLQLVLYRNTLFLYHVKIDPMKGVANWIIQCIGDRQLASHWIYDFSFYNKATGKQVRTSDTCTSNEVHANLSYNAGDCVSLPLNTVIRLMEPSNNLCFKFFLKRDDDLEHRAKPMAKPIKNPPKQQASHQK